MADSFKSRAWVLFDRIIAEAAPDGEHSNPWHLNSDGHVVYLPDYPVLRRLLGVPLYLGAATQTGVPALALDVWLSYELRRAGFDPDSTWPRATHPRILPKPVTRLVNALPRQLKKQVQELILKRSSIPGVSTASADILGKNYLKQVDVIMTGWETGPELLISTKRMDSSYGKNAANRVEESYGDAKNLRLRHPLAALGFVFGLRSDILESAPKTAEWIIDLLGKLGEEEDAYHATCLVLMDYAGPAASDGDAEPENDALAQPGADEPEDEVEPDAEVAQSLDSLDLDSLPPVTIRDDETPEHLAPATFLDSMVRRVLRTTPVTMHEEARERLRSPIPMGD